jgi:hypothetical protein
MAGKRGMGAQDYADLQRSKGRGIDWAGGILLTIFAASGTYMLDKETNIVNILAARMTNSETSRVPFAYTIDRYAEKAANAVDRFTDFKFK